MKHDVGGLKVPLACKKDKTGEEFYITPEIDMTVDLKGMVMMFFPAEDNETRGVLIIKPRRPVVSAMLKDLSRIEGSRGEEEGEADGQPNP